MLSMIENSKRKPSAWNCLEIEKALGLEQNSLWNLKTMTVDRILFWMEKMTPDELGRLSDYTDYIVYCRKNAELNL